MIGPSLGLVFLLHLGGCDGVTYRDIRQADSHEKICQQPKEIGKCKGQFNVYYFNFHTKECTPFVYSGCGGNDNLFSTITDCEQKCKARPQNVCEQDKDPGPCYGAIDRWFFNARNDKCEVFSYGGCMGNDNNFISQSHCENHCVKGIDEKETCSLNKHPGPCKSFQVRWYFNLQKKECEHFSYGGCQGNKNNFASHLECERTCYPLTNPQYICNLPKDSGPCDAKLSRYFFNPHNQICEKFVYGGCQGNANNFDTIVECEKKCKKSKDRCDMPKDIGPCKASVPRYYYNTETGKCDYFNYGGCKGNTNNFETKSQCHDACIAVGCSQPMKPGNCNEKLKRFYYNSFADRCQEFIYSGCQKNRNNFELREECESSCRLPSEEVPPTQNPCEEGTPLIDKETHSEVKCDTGDKAQCPSSHECSNSFCCPRARNPACLMDPAKGRCSNRLRRYFFNKRRNRCEAFTFTGCHGNDNNFETRQDCEQTCDYIQEIKSTTITTVFTPGKLCQYGEPLRDRYSNRARACGFGPNSRPCPADHECLGGSEDTIAICCPLAPISEVTQPPKLNPCSPGKPLFQENTDNPISCGPGYSSCPKSFQCKFIEGTKSAVCCPSSGLVEQTNLCNIGKPLKDPFSPANNLPCDSNNRKCPLSFECVNKVCCPISEINDPPAFNPCKVGEPLKHGFWNKNVPCNKYVSCPSTHTCLDEIADAPAVCCPKSDSVTVLSPINPCKIGEPLKHGSGKKNLLCSKHLSCPSTHICFDEIPDVPGVCCPKSASVTDICKLLPDRGESCGNRSRRFFYDTSKTRCRAFYYNGCQGNANNFKTRTECEKSCP